MIRIDQQACARWKIRDLRFEKVDEQELGIRRQVELALADDALLD